MNNTEIIALWKSNEKPFGLCPKEAQEWLIYLFRGGLLLCFNGEQWTQIGSHFCSKDSVCPEKAYRINSEYEPKPTPVGRWVECEVRAGATYYHFQFGGCDRDLSEAPGMVGFGGVRYEGSEEWFELGYQANCDGTGSMRPLKPLAVRFWVEG